MWTIFKWIGKILFLAGVLFVVGTVGADDRAVMAGYEIFSFEELVLRCAIGFGVTACGFLVYKEAEFYA